uniref:uncharacterized protein LOC122610994 n=1 Tax=Erigeron canadensis TaxID=72917 RepID=UPI001CB92DC6|nr:uncharacterized protein LOC122610994 [Erigeron canadensis]
MVSAQYGGKPVMTVVATYACVYNLHMCLDELVKPRFFGDIAKGLILTLLIWSEQLEGRQLTWRLPPAIYSYHLKKNKTKKKHVCFIFCNRFLSLDLSLDSSLTFLFLDNICAPTSEELKQKIYSLFRNIQPADGENALFEFWGAQKAGKAYVLTITDQPFGLFGNNKELQLYHNANLKNKLYVHPDKKVAFGLSGHAFLTCTSVQTQNLHYWYPEDERPPSDDDAIFSRIWGSFAVPLIVDERCVGVLQFVMDTPKDSYDSDIDKVYRALEMERPIQKANLQTPIQNDEPKTINKKIRRSKSFKYTKYSCLVPHFGLTKNAAAAKLGLKRTTFKSVCNKVRIYEWPRIPCTNPKTRTSTAAARKTSSSQIPVALEDKLGCSDDSSSYTNTDTFELPHEKATNDRAPIPETQIDQFAASKTRLSQIPADTQEEINHCPDNWSFNMDMDTSELPCEQTKHARTSVPETQIDQIADIETRPLQISVGIPEDNGFPDNCFSDMYIDSFELQCEQTINARLSVPETQIYQTTASETRFCDYPVYMQNTTNLSDNWYDMDTVTFELSREQTTNARAPIHGAQIDQIVASKTSPSQIPADTLEDINSDNCFSDKYMDNSTFQLLCEQTIKDRLFVPETQINPTAASEIRPFEDPVYDLQNTTNSFDNWDMNIILEGLCEQTTTTRASVSEAHINQNAPDVTRNIEFEHPGADKMNYQGKVALFLEHLDPVGIIFI